MKALPKQIVSAFCVSSVIWGCGAPAQQVQAEAVAPKVSVDEVDHSFRAKAPTGGPVPDVRAPVPSQQVLANGLTLITVQKNDLPLVHARVVIRSGSAQDPKNLPGLAGFTADMLKAGTKTRSAKQIAEEVETLGASIDVGVDDDVTFISVTALKENFDKVYEVLADVLQNSTFSSDETERTRKRRISALAQEEDEPSSTASRVFAQRIFGDHPYAHATIGTGEALKAIKTSDLKKFFQAHFRPANAALIIVGDIGADMADKAMAPLKNWKGAAGATVPPADATPIPPELTLVNKMGAPQSQLRIGHLGVARNDKDYFPLLICNAILGGMFNSRINMNLREAKGYTYGARSVFDFARARGSFVVYTGVRTDATAESIKEVLKEIERMRTTDVNDTELTNAKNSYSLSLPGQFQSVASIASMMANIYLYDLPASYYQELPEKIRAVTTADVRRVAEAHLKPEQLSIVVVGNKEQIAPGLAGLGQGQVRERAASGKAL